MPAPKRAEWGVGHSVLVLLKVYVKCIDGQEDAAKRRMNALAATEDTKPRELELTWIAPPVAETSPGGLRDPP